MKRMITIVLILGALALIYQFFVLFITNKHDATYSVKTSDNSYMIQEKYKRKDGFNIYYLKIEDKNKNNFVLSFDVDLNRQSRIVKDIKEYKGNSIYCIAPILKDKQLKDISCNYKNQQVSITYLHQINNKEIDNFINDLKNQGYEFNNEIDKTTNIVKTQDNISIYDDLDEDLFITIWGYKNLYIANNKTIQKKDLLNKDSYFNDYGILCDKYYVALNTDEKEFTSFFVANIKNGGKAKVEFDYIISRNSYFNGIHKGKIYLTDIDYKRQYVINPATEKIEEVGTSNELKYYDGKILKDVDIAFLTQEKRYFINNEIKEELSNKYKGYSLIESYGNYYYLDTDGSVYQIVSDYSDYKILLFNLNSFKEFKIINNNIFGISNDTIYMYNNNVGLRKVISYRELNYNYKNMYDVYYS